MPKIDQINNKKDLAFLLFHYADEVEGKTELQKLIFLLQEETEFKERYPDLEFEFTAYKYGPFSERVFDELEFLLSIGAIEAIDPEEEVDFIRDETDPSDPYAGKRFVVTEKGEKIMNGVNAALDDDLQVEFEEVIDQYTDLSLQELLEYVYKQYPEYTTESEIKEKILG
ncbi:type II toxin-antitoxin system antitoxin SocA domain-containing protein [Natrialba asiatica]|uniref:Antitoxin SocA-like Panacea domain-containing protein n=1 Tax=Natrialba asiatica (strain ATCC 700177 / DSM 12278 / JCM 9576 / FERM P-10747 / NBRC 102637 / 172P1) TaxID=29540 RepID=M0APZ9_NATA1|nr:type II toxin-antitoxin system antitoxin SocA domain-containing protein [Natrialba asiatica]ELY99458.1 hypothetical protein C481_14533 [Natrialba asiatica DSM 12278]